MCKRGDQECVWIERRSPSYKGYIANIDMCLVRLIKALNIGGVYTKACCCGHGEADGQISLHDGRELILPLAPVTTMEP